MSRATPPTSNNGSPPPVRITIDGSVASIVLCRPDTGNPIDMEFIELFGAAITDLGVRSEIRAVLIRAEGSAFSVGGNLQYMLNHVDSLSEEFGSSVPAYNALLLDLAGLDVPVICAVQGAAAGGALGLLWCSDVVIAGDNLKLTTAFSRLGLSGDGGSTWMLPRLLGPRKAFQVMSQSLVLDATTSQASGLVDQVVPVAALQSEAVKVAASFAAGPTVALRHLKQLIRRSERNTFAEQLADERSAMIECGRTADVVEGVRASVERRTPDFAGG